MKRLVRLVSLWALIGVLASMIPPAPAGAVPRPVGGLVPPVHHQAAPPPRPAEAKPGGYTVEEAERLIAERRLDDFPPLYRAGYFDGTFSQRGPRVLLGAHPDQPLSGTTAAETVFDLPAGAQSMAFSANIRGGMFSAGLEIYARPAGAASRPAIMTSHETAPQEDEVSGV